MKADFYNSFLRFSDHRFNNFFFTDIHLMHTCSFIFIKIKTDHIAFIGMIMIEITCKLLLSPSVILFTVPDFQLNNILYAAIIYNQIRSFQIPRPGFDIEISASWFSSSERKK